jgi:GntR family transcriptional regulator
MIQTAFKRLRSPMTGPHASAALPLTFSLDSTRPVPLYQQLSESLRNQVLSSNWPADYAIPSERELMRLTGLSRMTVRQAIDSLTREGLLTRVHGRGTFVVPPRVDQDLAGVYSFSERMRSEGWEVSTTVAEAWEAQATADEANLLGLDEGAAIFRLTRVRCIEDEPLLVNKVWLPAHLVPGLLNHDLTASLYSILQHSYEMPPLRSIDTLEAIGAPRDIAEVLGVRPGSPITLVRRVATTHGEVPIEMTEEYTRSDRMRYQLQQWADPLLDRRRPAMQEEVRS